MTQDLSNAGGHYDTGLRSEEKVEQLKTIGRERLQKLIPKDAKACR